MSAYADIEAALSWARPPKPGWERIVLIGVSAEKSLAAEIAMDKVPSTAMHEIGGCHVMRPPSNEKMRGWTIRDSDPLGTWHDLAGRPQHHPDYDTTPLIRVG